MRFVYFGTGTFAVPALRALAPYVELVVTQPDRPSGRNLRLTPSPVKLAAHELGIEVADPVKSRAPEFVERLESIRPDALFVASYGQILSVRMLDAAIRGGINLHGSILPKYRGAAPIQRCILDGETESGVTLMQMDKGMDTGDMISIARTPIGPDETYGELQDRLALIAAELARDWAERIASGEYPRTPQDPALATHAPKIDKSEAELRVDRVAHHEYNRFRAFTPSPGAFIRTEHGSVRLSALRLSQERGAPGVILATSPQLRIAFENGSIDFVEIQPEGKKRMSGRDFANGARLRPGMCFVSTNHDV